MHLILLSGGSGKRLWPLSNGIRSKQFLKIIKDDRGKLESMLQRVYRQINQLGEWSSVTIATSSLQKDQIRLQLGEQINILEEPERRDTFPAIALACSYLYSEKAVGPEEALAIMPVDPYVDLDYFHRIKDMAKFLQDDSTNDLVLMGVKPANPSDKFGYILPDAKAFKEKPSPDQAEALIRQGALWNCGVFGFKLAFILNLLKDKYGLADPSYSMVYENYGNLPKTSFDYEVLEKTKNFAVVTHDGQWKDLGTWQALTEEMENLAQGNVIMDGLCSNTHVINELDIPLLAVGIDDSIIVASHDGILVSSKEESGRVKDLLKDKDFRPRHERRRWGCYKILEETATTVTKKLLLQAGKSISYQYHSHRQEIWTITEGRGILYFEGQKREVQPGEVVIINKGEKHGIKALTDLHIIEVQIGHQLSEEDIVRLEYVWE